MPRVALRWHCLRHVVPHAACSMDSMVFTEVHLQCVTRALLVSKHTQAAQHVGFQKCPTGSGLTLWANESHLSVHHRFSVCYASLAAQGADARLLSLSCLVNMIFPTCPLLTGTHAHRIQDPAPSAAQLPRCPMQTARSKACTARTLCIPPSPHTAWPCMPRHGVCKQEAPAPKSLLPHVSLASAQDSDTSSSAQHTRAQPACVRATVSPQRAHGQ